MAFQLAIERLNKDHTISLHLIKGALIICSKRASVESLLTDPEEHVDGPLHQVCSIPEWYSPKKLPVSALRAPNAAIALPGLRTHIVPINILPTCGQRCQIQSLQGVYPQS